MVNAAFVRMFLRSVCVGLMIAVVAMPAFAQPSAYDAVNPMIGTGADGHTFPGATVPFGMV
jgi:putative alpha-1,2-mannosidase